MNISLLTDEAVILRLSAKSSEPRPSNLLALRVPPSGLIETWEQLRERTDNQVESLALWVGQYNHEMGYVTGVIYPEVFAHPLRVEMVENERPVMGQWLREKGLRVLAELHTHQEEAFLSDVDQRYPLVSQPGFLQIVVPYFAAGSMNWKSAAVFGLSRDGWYPIDPSLIQSWEV